MNSPVPPSSEQGTFVTDAALKRLKKRHAAESRFKLYGQLAIGIAIVALVTLLASIFMQASSAFTRHVLTFDTTLEASYVTPEGERDPEKIARNVSGFNLLLQDELSDQFLPEDPGLSLQRELYGLFTRLAVLPLARKTADTPSNIGTQQSFSVALADDIDLYLKGGITRRKAVNLGQAGAVSGSMDDGFNITLGKAEPLQSALDKFREDEATPTALIQIGSTWFRMTGLDGNTASLEYIAGTPQAPVSGADVSGLALEQAQDNRTVTDRQIAWTMLLEDEGRVKSVPNTTLFTNSDSTYPELAGTAAAIVGSLLTMLVCAMLAIPVGIFAAVYLEEFAVKNRVTDLIEVNINNLAAVPSIVFGLLGAAVFINFMGLPRSVPLVGGLVLGLLVLPTVIIASRAALKSVPPSIRTAALGVGASKTQAVFHHVLPLAAPGILTGSIIGMARALGETAPLLLIGMVAFVAEVPDSPTDESTVLPVLIYKWSTGAERAWEPQTAAAIIVLLVFLVLMNLIAIILRRRFERRW
ncbi:phosphate ABC transporter permease PstA [Henriciella aquimarina]|uniref:phosphate ABC transporter permease PstA n=1 Tax=Henriciella aquimarina TaxID=545261 RepID=UPI0009FDDBAD|nr:phosphate ABC transporter permease PstA [Henriciella aquimarina]